MLWFVSILFFTTTVWLWLHIRRTRRLLSELQEAVHAKRCLLPETSMKDIQSLGMHGLVEGTNQLIEQHQKFAAQNTSYSRQIEAMLHAVKEVVVIFNDERVIEFSNRSAESLFHKGLNMRGKRVDVAMRSLALLEFLEKSKATSPNGDNQISIESEGEALWFEVSCSRVRGIAQSKGMSSLLVLHDITRLKSLEVMRREFVANVSHELRTPLTIIKGFTETLVEDHEELPPEMRGRYLGKVLNNVERLHVLVEDLLALSRLESKTDQYEPVQQPLRPLFEEVLGNYENRLKDEKAMVLTFDDQVEMVAFDRFQLNQVLDNLVMNVFRYAPDFTKLEMIVRYDETSKSVVCSVVDDGPGIPESDLPHIFERFYRVDKGRSQERGGTGLGLSIVKHIIQLHGGSVDAESQLGEWTKMTFTLPME